MFVSDSHMVHIHLCHIKGLSNNRNCGVKEISHSIENKHAMKTLSSSVEPEDLLSSDVELLNF